MGNSNFNKNGLDKSGDHWLQYAAFVVTAFTIYFGCAFSNNASFHHFQLKYLSFGIEMDKTL